VGLGLGLTGRAASVPAPTAYRPELIHLGSRFKYFPDLNKKMEKNRTRLKNIPRLRLVKAAVHRQP